MPRPRQRSPVLTGAAIIAVLVLLGAFLLPHHHDHATDRGGACAQCRFQQEHATSPVIDLPLATVFLPVGDIVLSATEATCGIVLRGSVSPRGPPNS